jgi:hypothetical protein
MTNEDCTHDSKLEGLSVDNQVMFNHIEFGHSFGARGTCAICGRKVMRVYFYAYTFEVSAEETRGLAGGCLPGTMDEEANNG